MGHQSPAFLEAIAASTGRVQFVRSMARCHTTRSRNDLAAVLTSTSTRFVIVTVTGSDHSPFNGPWNRSRVMLYANRRFGLHWPERPNHLHFVPCTPTPCTLIKRWPISSTSALWYPNFRLDALPVALDKVMEQFVAVGGSARVSAATAYPISWNETPTWQRVYRSEADDEEQPPRQPPLPLPWKTPTMTTHGSSR